MKKLLIGLLILTCSCLAITVYAGSGTNIGGIAGNILTNLATIVKLITAIAYLLGIALVLIALAKLKAHREAPTQIPLSQPITFLFIGFAMIFLPTIFLAGGGTLFGPSGGKVAGVSGITSFGAKVAGS